MYCQLFHVFHQCTSVADNIFDLDCEVGVVVLLEQGADGLELRVLGGVHELEQQRLRGGEGHIRRVLHPLQRNLAVICPAVRDEYAIFIIQAHCTKSICS